MRRRFGLGSLATYRAWHPTLWNRDSRSGRKSRRTQRSRPRRPDYQGRTDGCLSPFVPAKACQTGRLECGRSWWSVLQFVLRRGYFIEYQQTTHSRGQFCPRESRTAILNPERENSAQGKVFHGANSLGPWCFAADT